MNAELISRDEKTAKEGCLLKKKTNEITIRSSAAEYLTYVAAAGDQRGSSTGRQDYSRNCKGKS